jgi:hypothetical protein
VDSSLVVYRGATGGFICAGCAGYPLASASRGAVLIALAIAVIADEDDLAFFAAWLSRLRFGAMDALAVSAHA